MLDGTPAALAPLEALLGPALDEVQWWADDDAPETPVTVIGHNIVGCG